jgi:acyl-CoA synthetase (AMP-forming)/AMP-acid ligase II
VAVRDLLYQAHHLSLEVKRRVRDASRSPCVACLSPRDHHYPVAQFGTWLSGGIFVPLHTRHPLEEIAYVLRDSGASVVLVHKTLRFGFP